jgi:uncharacterized integral membrane protein
VFRFTLGIVFGILALILIFQNIDNVSVTFLAWTITTSRAVILFLILAIGLILGWAFGSIGRWKRKSNR